MLNINQSHIWTDKRREIRRFHGKREQKSPTATQRKRNFIYLKTASSMLQMILSKYM